MKAKPISSELEAREKLIVYVYEYLTKVNAKRAADLFLQEICYDKTINVNTLNGPGFLGNWWYVFWDLYCAAPEKRAGGLAEPSPEARAFIEYISMRPSMSPHHQTPPPHQPPYMQPGPSYALQQPNHPGGPQPPQMRHHGPPGQPMNVGPPRMSMGQHLPPSQMGGPPQAPQMGGPPQQPQMGGPPPPPQMGGPPPPPQMGGPPPPPQMGGPPMWEDIEDDNWNGSIGC